MFLESVLPYLDFLGKSAVVIGGCIGFIVWIRSELIVLKVEVQKVIEHQKLFNESLKQLNNILTQIAVQDVRINMIEKDIDELRHGQGFVKEKP